MNLLFRLIWLMVTVRRKPPLTFHDVDRLPMRARWTDLDQLRHVNNGVFLSMMDLGRVDLMVRAGVWKQLMDAGIYPVVAAQTITYRKSLQWRQRFVLETRMAGYHDKALFVEQRFVVDGEIYARAFVKARFLKRSGGTVSIEELNAIAGEDLTQTRWRAGFAAGPTTSRCRRPAPRRRANGPTPDCPPAAQPIVTWWLASFGSNRTGSTLPACQLPSAAAAITWRCTVRNPGWPSATTSIVTS